MSVTTTELHWVDATATKPDADTPVVIWTKDEYGRWGWEAAWWDGEQWRLAESGGLCAEEVTHWAEPAGPTC